MIKVNIQECLVQLFLVVVPFVACGTHCLLLLREFVLLLDSRGFGQALCLRDAWRVLRSLRWSHCSEDEREDRQGIRAVEGETEEKV